MTRVGGARMGWMEKEAELKKEERIYIYIYRVEQNDPVCGTKWSIEFITFALGLILGYLLVEAYRPGCTCFVQLSV